MSDPNFDPRMFSGLGHMGIALAQVSAIVTKNGAAIVISAAIAAVVSSLVPYLLIIPKMEERVAQQGERQRRIEERLDNLAANIAQNALGQVRSAGEDNAIKLRLNELERRMQQHEGEWRAYGNRK